MPPDRKPAFLRSPPFPGIAPASAAIAVADPARSGAVLPNETTVAAVAALRAARVGGSFWARPIARDDLRGRTVLRRVGGRAVVSGPSVGDLALGDVDPWSVVVGIERVEAAADDHWALVGFVAGIAVGHDAATMTAALARALGGWCWRDPYTGTDSDLWAAIDCLAGWRRGFDANRGIAAVTGIAWWKRRTIGRFLFDGVGSPPVLPPARAIAVAAAAGGAVAAWPSRVPAGFFARAAAAGVRVVQVEDGFLRSTGLGSELNQPSSIVVDRSGIHYDPAAPSDLETFLATAEFDAGLVARAAALRRALCRDAVGKYGQDVTALSGVVTRRGRTILVIGQVFDDRSVVLGRAGDVVDDASLLARVRTLEPDAHLVYRPHPDVIAGHRRSGRSAEALADTVATGPGLFAAMAAADAVHVITSLAGFEALLRGHKVVVHGRPFYAGWGLTDDRVEQPGRRGRHLTIDQLVAGALLFYPRYLDPVTGLPCSAEIVTGRLARSEDRRSPIVRLRRAQGGLRIALRSMLKSPA